MIARARILPLDHVRRGQSKRAGAATRELYGRQCGRAATLFCVRAGTGRICWLGVATADRDFGHPGLDPRRVGIDNVSRSTIRSPSCSAPTRRNFAATRRSIGAISVQRIRRHGRDRRQGPSQEGDSKLFAAPSSTCNSSTAWTGIVSLLSARGAGARAMPAPSFPTSCPRAGLRPSSPRRKGNEIMSGKLLSDDGKLTLVVLALDRNVGSRRVASVVQHPRTAERGADRHRPQVCS